MYQNLLLLLILLSHPLSALGDPLKYQSRGNYYEGHKNFPLASSSFELISALVESNENPSPAFPDKLKLSFYLDSTPGEKVYLTVKELDNQFNYWLDKVQQAWKAKTDNDFSWSTRVIRGIMGSTMADLGVVIRLGRENPSIEEHIAPAIFYSKQCPKRREKYVFTFKISKNTTFQVSVYNQNNKSIQKIPIKTIAGRPFSFPWDASYQPAGKYKLVIDEPTQKNSTPYQEVHFYHQPTVHCD